MTGNKKDRRARMQSIVARQQDALPDLTERALGIRRAATASSQAANAQSKPYVALKYFDHGFECFSAWTPDELRLFSGFLTKLSGLTWEQVPKVQGLGFKAINLATIAAGRDNLTRVRDKLSPDIGFVELRVNQRMRVHGFRVEDAFFLVLLDREHRLYPD